MPPRKGTATVKKAKSKFIWVDEDENEVASFDASSEDWDGPAPSSPTVKKAKKAQMAKENVDPERAREPPKRSIDPPQPRQDAPAASAPRQSDRRQPHPPPGRAPTHHSPPANHSPARTNAQQNNVSPPRNSFNIQDDNITNEPDTMIPGGAHIPPNQQRTMRACMVCSIVRTQQQFMTAGCPNCEDILELVGNPEQINDCTSQVFEGLITVADTSRSWVARYQRLEGYVPGVYATQVEGILPEDVLVAVENAGINYVPRDGSEQEMLGKD